MAARRGGDVVDESCRLFDALVVNRLVRWQMT